MSQLSVTAGEEHRTQQVRIMEEIKNKIVSTKEGAAAWRAMVNARRLFAFAGGRMLAIMERKGVNPHAAYDLVLAATKSAAVSDLDAKEFLDLFLGNNGTMMWLGDEIEAQLKEAKQAERQTRNDINETRRAKPIPVNLPFDPSSDKREMVRGSSVTLSGDAGAVRLVLDSVVQQIANAGFRVLHYTSRGVSVTPETTTHRNIVAIPASDWQGKGTTRRLMSSLISEFAIPIHADVVVFDDTQLLANASHFAIKGGHPGAVAGDMHRDLMRVCKELGIVVLCGVGQTPEHAEGSFDLTTAGWEQLRQFSTPLPVVVNEQDGGVVQITVGKVPEEVVTLPVEALLMARVNASRIAR
jgi:hypothetical protein